MSAEIQRAILEDGQDDWVPIWQVAALVEQPKLSEEENRAAALEVVRQLLERDFVQVGEVRDGEAFDPWHGSPSELVDRVEAGWTEAVDQHGDGWGWFCWLANTPAGDEAARGG